MRSKFTWIMTLLLALTFNFSFAQEKVVTGTVSDESGPLPGATIAVKGAPERSATADMDGNYSIKANQGEVLVISFIDYETHEVTVGASTVMPAVVLKQSGTMIEAVVLDKYRNITPVKS